MRRKLEYAAAWPFIKILGLMPRPLSRGLRALGWPRSFICCTSGCARWACAISPWRFRKRVRPSGSGILRGVFTSLGRQLAELCQFPRYTPENVEQVVVYDGLENYERAYARGKGVLFLTAHFGGWELSAFAHSLHGHWLHVVMRPMDNQYLDRLIQQLSHHAWEQDRGEG